MKVILTQFDKKLGAIGDVVNVSDGLANNLLIPQGKAKPFTPQAESALQKEQKQEAAIAQAKKEENRAIAGKIHKQKVVIAAKAKGQTLFGSVGTKEIAAAIKKEHRISVSPEMITLAEPIKEVSAQQITIDFGENVTAGVIVEVVGE